MDFYKIKTRSAKNGIIEVYPDFKVMRSEDLMVRGKNFYAIWNEEKNLWSTDEYDVQRLVDKDLYAYLEKAADRSDGVLQVRAMGEFSSGVWREFRNYISLLSDSSHQLDENLTFSNTEVRKSDYVSRRLQYPLARGDISAYNELISTLYDPSERSKLEWAIGAVVSGDAKHIQKFLVLYGSAGTGKSTVLNIIQSLFEGYYTTFEAKALTSSSNAFSTEVFKSNPLVAIQHDGDLSRIEDNTKLNSIVSHEDMTMNEKYKPSYMSKINAFLFMGTNKPVKITDSKSGIIRRLIDVHPSGDKLSPRRYQTLMSQINFELGAIAYHCLEVYREMGKDYYSSYRPVEMMLQTDVFFNYIETYYDIFRDQDGVGLSQAYKLYKEFCDDTLVEFKLPQHKFREELKNYFHEFEERAIIDGTRVRSWYSKFKVDQFKPQIKEEAMFSLVMDSEESIFDSMFADRPAQLAKEDGTPTDFWSNVETKLSDIDTSKVHYVQVPTNHIVIDFDLVDENGVKSAELNLEAASKWPATYAEWSQGGAGIHLHYNYAGDATELGRIYRDGIEIKVYTGNASLRRRLSKCNNVPVATLNSGLPLKEKKVINSDAIKSERGLRQLIDRNLKKEIHPGTKPSMDFIHKILEEAYSSGMSYDVSDMRPRIMAFANNSTNQSLYCLKLMATMKFKSEEKDPLKSEDSEDRLVFFDVEVFPNLFMLNWKYEDSPQVVRMINPKPEAVEDLFKYKLVGFYNRRYDNHILYAASLGYNNEQLYTLSQKLVSNSPGTHFGEAYNLSYVDIYDYASEKKSLKKWQIELGIKHKELGLPWDEPVPEDKWELVGEYCDNDVISTEAVHKARKGDFTARLILADLSGLSVNASTQQHAARIIFGTDKNAKEKFVYTDLSHEFPGYKYDMGKSYYRDEITGEGGYVYSEPGMYENVALLDVASMHPTSIEELELFGPYTERFSDIKNARMFIKRGDYESARKMFDGKLKKHLENEGDAESLSYALKIAINIVYGLTSAKFENPFRDNRNKDNIVAKRGALFMINLKHEVQERGFTVAHIKTDSIKIPNATREIIEFVMEYGKEYGYDFEHEATYEKMCLVNDAVYVAKVASGRKPAHWTAVGAQFQHPYVFKKLFSGEPLAFRDMCQEKHVTTAMYLDFSEESDVPMVYDEGALAMQFIGKAGLFCPVVSGGGTLLREKEGKFYAVGGTKGYKWLESEMVEKFDKMDDIDIRYFEELCSDAIDNISRFGVFEEFIK